MTVGTPGVAAAAVLAAAAELAVVENTLPNVDEMEEPDVELRRVTTVSLSFCSRPFIAAIHQMSARPVTPACKSIQLDQHALLTACDVTNWPRVQRAPPAAAANLPTSASVICSNRLAPLYGFLSF